VSHKVDFLIVGAGLAGSVLAWTLKEHGARVLLVSDSEIPAASRAAAGLINPVTGQRLVLQANIAALLEEAERFYETIESRFDIKLLHRIDMLRLFRNDREREAWEKRKADHDYREFIGTRLIRSDGFMQHHTGWLDTNLLLDTLHAEMRSTATLIEAAFDHAEPTVSDGSVRWQAIITKKTIFCEGWRGMHNPWFSYLPFQPAKGEILTMQGKSPQYIINRGRWLLPVGDNRFKLGATYDWRHLNDQPTQEAKNELLDALPELLANTSPAEVSEHVAGIRPGTMDKQPFIGLHPEHPSLSIFNGFGSKGSLLIPWHANRFADYLLDGIPLPSDCDISRF